MYHTQTWRECWENSKQSTAEHAYPKRLLVRMGHTALTRLLSSNPNGYPVPGRDGHGRVVAPASNHELLGTGDSFSPESVEPIVEPEGNSQGTSSDEQQQ